MIIFYQKTVPDQKLKILKSFKKESWIYVEEPSPEEIKHLAKTYQLELGHLKDALDMFEAPRLEIEPQATYIFTRAPILEANRITTMPVSIIISENFILTISAKELPLLKKFTTGQLDFSTTQKIKLFLKIFSQINTSYNSFLTSINREVRSTGRNLSDISNKDIEQFVVFEIALNDFLSDLIPIGTILKKLLSGKILLLAEDDKDLTEDLLLNNGQLIEICKTNLKSIENIRESYSTIMTNNLNRVIKILTAITVVLTLPVIITSLYGMNVPLPLSHSPFAFYIILGFTITATLALLGFLHKNHWL